MGACESRHSRLLAVCMLIGCGLSSATGADPRSDVQLLEQGDSLCGASVRTDDVALVDLEPLLQRKDEAVDLVHDRYPLHRLTTEHPWLIEKPLFNGRERRQQLVRNAMREAAARGCTLLLVLDVKTYDRSLTQPGLVGLKIPIAYTLVLFGFRSNVP